MRRSRLLLAMVVALLLAMPAAADGPILILEYPLPDEPGAPHQITAGPDGNVWFTNGELIERITPSGQVTTLSGGGEFDLVWDITTGPDSNLWFTLGSATTLLASIGRITATGVITSFALPTGTTPAGITTGPDGNLWFTEGNLGRITPTGIIREFSVPTGQSAHEGITTGPDGNIWFVGTSANKIGKALVLQTHNVFLPSVMR